MVVLGHFHLVGSDGVLAVGWATTSKFKAKLTASDGAVRDLFGWGVAVKSGHRGGRSTG